KKILLRLEIAAGNPRCFFFCAIVEINPGLHLAVPRPGIHQRPHKQTVLALFHLVESLQGLSRFRHLIELSLNIVLVDSGKSSGPGSALDVKQFSLNFCQSEKTRLKFGKLLMKLAATLERTVNEE